jgi:multidrug transporter EmrE-like cation transporter
MGVGFILMLAILFNSSANILIKWGMEGLKKGGTGGLLLKSWPLGVGVFFFALNLGCYAYVLGKMKLSVAYPIMMSMSFAVVIGSSVLVFKEDLSRLQSLGLFLILSGVVLLARDLK